MTPRPRTPQLRDKRFARVRRITQAVLIGSGVASGLFVGYAASIAKPLVPVPTTTPQAPTPTSSSTPTTVARSGDDSSAPASTPASTPSNAPAPAPSTPTTTCYTTPSGTQVCY